jgi:hypothetical protein
MKASKEISVEFWILAEEALTKLLNASLRVGESPIQTHPKS